MFRIQLRSLTMFAAWICASSLAQAANYAFTIDSTQSSLSFSGSIDFTNLLGAGITPLTEQGSGSLTSSLTGTLNVDTNLANAITFNAGSSIVPDISGNWSPQAGGAAGTQLAQYGWRFVLDSDFGLLTLDTALNEIEFDLTSTLLVMSNGDFDASQLILPWLEVNSDFRLEGLQSGTSHEFDISAEPNQLSAGTLVVAGNLATLTIPIHVMVADSYADNPGEIFVSGQIVATAVIPEPSSSLLLLFGGCLLMGVKKFRNSRGRLL